MKHNMEKKSRKSMKASEHKQIVHYCKKSPSDKKRTSIVGFSKSLILLKMQSYIARQDWKHALNLFPRLLECPIELEPLIWRYAFIILLHTNNPLHLHQFFEQCIGNQSSNNSILLEKLLLLPLKDN